MTVPPPAITSSIVPVCLRLPKSALPFALPEELVSRWVTQPGFFWLDSGDVQIGEDGWSYMGIRPSRTIECRDRLAVLTTPDGEEILGERSPLSALDDELSTLRTSPKPSSTRASGAPPFCGGWLTVLGYDLGREIERLPDLAEHDLPFPDLYLARYPVVFAFDHRLGDWWAACQAPEDCAAKDRESAAFKMVNEILRDMPAIGSCPADAAETKERDVRSNFKRSDYEKSVQRGLAYIAAGDIYQVNLSQRFAVEWNASGWALYSALREQSASRYGALISMGADRWACSISPELLLSVKSQLACTRPIKGTRPRGSTPEEDRRLAKELESSVKDRAELTMIVDLERNDLGRVCEYGSVRVDSPGELETHPTVFHRTATVTGRLRASVSVGHLLRAIFPGGSVTGAPKIRAMEIIEELEPTRRGPYCGGIGWIGFDGDLALNLPIRTALLDGASRTAWYQAGGGIVADSDPGQEYEETVTKARAFFRAVNGRLVQSTESENADRK